MRKPHNWIVAAVQEKKGGPYSKSEREKRQREVTRLHFENGYSASKIAEMMKINRNTINADIKNLYSNIKEEIKQDSEDLILRQIGRLDAQRSRIIKNITENKIDDIRYEKMLLDVDQKINDLCMRINSNVQEKSGSFSISDEKIKDIVLFLIIKHSSYYSLRREDIISEIINMEQITKLQADLVFSQMNGMGLECCKRFQITESRYDLLEFAFLRKYLLPNDEFIKKIYTLRLLDMSRKTETREISNKFKEKHGSKEKWTDEIFDEYEQEKTKMEEKNSETEHKLIVDCLEKLSDKDKAEEYAKYMKVVFGKEEKDRFAEYLE